MRPSTRDGDVEIDACNLFCNAEKGTHRLATTLCAPLAYRPTIIIPLSARPASSGRTVVNRREWTPTTSHGSFPWGRPTAWTIVAVRVESSHLCSSPTLAESLKVSATWSGSSTLGRRVANPVSVTPTEESRGRPVANLAGQLGRHHRLSAGGLLTRSTSPTFLGGWVGGLVGLTDFRSGGRPTLDRVTAKNGSSPDDHHHRTEPTEKKNKSPDHAHIYNFHINFILDQGWLNYYSLTNLLRSLFSRNVSWMVPLLVGCWAPVLLVFAQVCRSRFGPFPFRHSDLALDEKHDVVCARVASVRKWEAASLQQHDLIIVGSFDHQGHQILWSAGWRLGRASPPTLWSGSAGRQFGRPTTRRPGWPTWSGVTPGSFGRGRPVANLVGPLGRRRQFLVGVTNFFGQRIANLVKSLAFHSRHEPWCPAVAISLSLSLFCDDQCALADGWRSY